ncbi:DUF6470 family protein [Paenibacillus harenae]|uniref:DUF6470 family protein n=1 Tax=Paenibacillus harenae TaxID=306543 RepID=UPI00279015A3|nr:DUF6470 family protein [Paenibacillus harenae]MDQ0062037.1 hypothetical protein [Paenibacillus harenae]
MNDLRLSIRQTFAAIGLNSQPAQQMMDASHGEQEIVQPQAKMNFATTPSHLEIDSSEAWQALGRGPHMEWNQRLFGQMKSVFLQQLAQTVDEGKRMAQITNPNNAFAEIAKGSIGKQSPVNYVLGTPNVDNVKVTYTPGAVNTAIEPSPVEIQYTPIKTDIQVEQGKLEMYLRQKNSISIDVTTYDWYK